MHQPVARTANPTATSNRLPRSVEFFPRRLSRSLRTRVIDKWQGGPLRSNARRRKRILSRSGAWRTLLVGSDASREISLFKAWVHCSPFNLLWNSCLFNLHYWMIQDWVGPQSLLLQAKYCGTWQVLARKCDLVRSSSRNWNVSFCSTTHGCVWWKRSAFLSTQIMFQRNYAAVLSQYGWIILQWAAISERSTISLPVLSVGILWRSSLFFIQKGRKKVAQLLPSFHSMRWWSSE